MIHLSATSIGPIAADILASHREVEVLAVFEHSFYVITHGGLACFGAESIGRGPINVPLADAGKIDWRAIGIATELEGEAGPGRLTIGEVVRISLADAEPWLPPDWAPFDPPAAQRGLAALSAQAAGRLPKEGLASLVFDAAAAPRSPEAKAAAAEVACLVAQMPDHLATNRLSAESRRSLTLLLGLGPGLTPSGDDLIGGMMLALTALGRERLRDAIWDVLTPELGDLTTEISAMHLSAAADGMGAAAMHDLANAIIEGDEAALPAFLERVSHIGHCSGWDTMAGFVLMLDAARRLG